MFAATTVVAWLLAVWLLSVAVQDARHRTVPNGLVLAGSLLAISTLGLGLQPLATSWPSAALGALLGLLGLMPFYAFGLMGAGDVKFAAALGLWLGPWGLLQAWLGASLLAGLHALWRLVVGRLLGPGGGIQFGLSKAGDPAAVAVPSRVLDWHAPTPFATCLVLAVAVLWPGWMAALP